MNLPFLTWAEIDLDAIAMNVQAYKDLVGQGVEVFAVLKANAYGHGASPVGRVALESGATRIAVHRLNEGVDLRKEGIFAPILLMGYTPAEDVKEILAWHLTPTVTTLEFAEALSQQASVRKQNTSIHLKIDSGMSRYGLFPDEAVDFARKVSRLPHLVVEGVFTHFSTADSADETFLRSQQKVFSGVVDELRAAGIQVPLIHAANSAAVMKYPEGRFTAVRTGIGMYGLRPSTEWEPVFPLHPALSLKSRIARLRNLPPGSAVSYGRTYVSKSQIRAALVPVGYGDGYPRNLSNIASVLVNGKRAPIIGRVCMDQFVIDVSEIPGVQQDDEVVLIGRQGEACITAEELAELAGTINYEITTRLLPRVPRLYLSRKSRPRTS